MAKQSITIEKVHSVAADLKSANDIINDAFQRMERSAAALGKDWKSSAGAAAQTKLYEIFKGNAARSSVLAGYRAVLERAVAPEYMSAESINSRLADQFH